jgi:triphosphoribosyl-dephospho-CoA synthase
MTPAEAAVPAGDVLTAADVAAAAQLACLLEASAPKPGNVCPGRHFADLRYEDFLASAVAIAGPIAEAGTRPLGQTIRRAVEATARWTQSNANLGIVLLLSPLAKAALGSDPGTGRHRGQTPERGDSRLRDELRRVLDGTTIDDAREVYAAIRLASPGGLGRAESQDVADEPTTTLRGAMELAADRDGIAREYVSAFETTFTLGAPTLERARSEGLAWDDAVVETFLTLLAAAPDTHITRRGGEHIAADVSRRAGAVLRAGGVRAEEGRRAIEDMDVALRGDGNIANPGTTADLTAAAIFVVLLDGGWRATPGGSDAGAQ